MEDREKTHTETQNEAHRKRGRPRKAENNAEKNPKSVGELIQLAHDRSRPHPKHQAKHRAMLLLWKTCDYNKNPLVK